MTQQLELREKVVDAKNHGERKFQHLTNNFYLMKSALRYYTVKKKMSFTSSKISDDFPIAVSVAGSGLSVLEELEVIQPRTESSSKRYMPEEVSIQRLEEVEEILRENYEIEEYY
jgi:hypothetical protein